MLMSCAKSRIKLSLLGRILNRSRQAYKFMNVLKPDKVANYLKSVMLQATASR